MKHRSAVFGIALGLLALVIPSYAQTNIAVDGTAILGKNDGTNLSTLGVSYQHSNTSGHYSDINDGFTLANTGTSTSTDDTYGAGTMYSYVGITYTPAQLAAFQGESITSLNLYLFIFGDGGWFGQRSTGLSGGLITAAELITPQLQITTDGVTWTDVAATSNYTSSVADGGLAGQGGGNTGPLTFTLDTPVSLDNLEGIRLIGVGGGTASNGFLGVNELQVIAGAVPEPSTYAMLIAGLGALAFAASLRRLA